MSRMLVKALDNIMALNTTARNSNLPATVSKVTKWHHDRNLINGTTDLKQTKKLLEEFTELVAAQLNEASSEYIYDEIVSMLDSLLQEGRIKPVKGMNQPQAKKDALGDMAVVMINIAERNTWTFDDCLNTAYKEIEHRTGKMVNGTFVKSGDLNDQC